jgi:hypothetical protein
VCGELRQGARGVPRGEGGILAVGGPVHAKTEVVGTAYDRLTKAAHALAEAVDETGQGQRLPGVVIRRTLPGPTMSKVDLILKFNTNAVGEVAGVTPGITNVARIIPRSHSGVVGPEGDVASEFTLN